MQIIYTMEASYASYYIHSLDRKDVSFILEETSILLERKRSAMKQKPFVNILLTQCIAKKAYVSGLLQKKQFLKNFGFAFGRSRNLVHKNDRSEWILIYILHVQLSFRGNTVSTPLIESS